MSFYREGEIEGERSRQGGKDKDRAREGKRYVRERERQRRGERLLVAARGRRWSRSPVVESRAEIGKDEIPFGLRFSLR